MSRRIHTYDSTLRDGEQCEGITLSLADKLRIVERLDAFGIDYIEGGFPASNLSVDCRWTKSFSARCGSFPWPTRR